MRAERTPDRRHQCCIRWLSFYTTSSPYDPCKSQVDCKKPHPLALEGRWCWVGWHSIGCVVKAGELGKEPPLVPAPVRRRTGPRLPAWRMDGDGE